LKLGRGFEREFEPRAQQVFDYSNHLEERSYLPQRARQCAHLHRNPRRSQQPQEVLEDGRRYRKVYRLQENPLRTAVTADHRPAIHTGDLLLSAEEARSAVFTDGDPVQQLLLPKDRTDSADAENAFPLGDKPRRLHQRETDAVQEEGHQTADQPNAEVLGRRVLQGRSESWEE
jgi:hypothetical protein